jgi:hypothetical protein
MKTPIGCVVLDLVNFTFGVIDRCLNFVAKILPNFVSSPILETFDGTKVFSIAMLEASDTRFQILSDFVKEHFPSFYEWLIIKTEKVSNVAQENANALQVHHEQASEYLKRAFDTWRGRVASVSHTVKMNVHPIVHAVAVRSSPVFEEAKRIVQPTVVYFEPIWGPVRDKATAYNESLKHNELVGK